MKTRILITEDHEMYLEGLSLLLQKQDKYSIIGTYPNATTLLDALPNHEADILLLDVHLPDMEAEVLLKAIRQKQPTIKVLYLTLMRGTRNVHKLVRHQIEGYILKNANISELCEAIDSIHRGGTYFTPEIDITETDKNFRHTVSVDDKRISDILTKREIEILKLVCQEYSNSDIAGKLFLSVGTIETHRKNIIAKLGVNNTVGLVKYALRNNLMD